MIATTNAGPCARYEFGGLDESRGLARAAIAAGACPARTPGGAENSTDDRSDETLMARVVQGDRRAIRLLFERHQLKVYRFALRLVGNSAAAEDIVSEVFIELWRHAASFEGRARLSTWILAIARNKAVSAMRRRIDQPLDEAAAEAIPDHAATAEDSLVAAERSALLRRCLAQLSAEHREIIDLVYYHERSIEEAAAILGIPAGTIKTRMFHARRRLAEHLKAADIGTMRA
jgi:RNA polymerase sigma-70 factor (ECF subfamily)